MQTSQINRGLLLALAFLAAWSTLCAAQENLTSYDITVTLLPDTQTLVGAQRVDYVNDTGEPLDEITFCLIGNWATEQNPHLHPALLDEQYVAGFDPTWTRIHAVTSGNRTPISYRLDPFPPALQTFSLDDALLVVELTESLPPGERTSVEIEFETKFAEALLMDTCVYRETYVWRFGWHPIAVPTAARDGRFELPTGTYHVELTVPDDLTVFAGADRQTLLDASDGVQTIAFDNDQPRRSIPLIIGADLKAVSTKRNDVEIHAVYLPGGETFARLALSLAAEILDDHTEHYGPFGYQRLVIAENPSPGLFGLGADGMILYGTDFAQLKDMPALGTYDRLAEYLLAHELAHLWWGIGIGVDFNAENWISEGFAEFLSYSYFEDKYGAFEPNLLAHLGDGLVEDILAEQFGYLNLRQHLAEASYLDLLHNGFDEAIVKPLAEVEYLNGQTVRTYSKGYLVLRALEGLIGEQAMESMLQEARAEWFGRTLNVVELQRLTEQVSGTDLSSFFDDWIYGDAQLDVVVDGFETLETATGYRTSVFLRREGSALPVEVGAVTAEETTVRKLWHAASEKGTLVFDTEEPVVRVHVDPGELLPDRNRFNNHWPRRILVDHPFRSPDAPAIGRPLDAYVLTVLPLAVSGSYRIDHQWSVTAMPHVDPDADVEELDLERMLTTFDIVGAFAANVHRGLSISARVRFTELSTSGGTGEVDAALTAHTLFFSHPETGTAGTYWYPAYRFDATVGALGELSQPIPYVELAAGLSDLLTLYMDNAVTLQLGIPGFGTAPFATLAWNGYKRSRLAHLLYLDLEVAAATAWTGELPSEFLFSLESMHTSDRPPAGRRLVHGRIELVLPPLARDLGYAILNLTRIDDITPSLFVQGGRIWGGCDAVCTSEIHVEYGGALTIRLAGFLGVPIEFSIGYAHPVIGPDGKGTPFLEFGGGF
jgi:hypothetical protein